MMTFDDGKVVESPNPVPLRTSGDIPTPLSLTVTSR